MSRFDDYATKYSCIHMRRENGILEMRFHTDNGPLRRGLGPHGELPDAFADVARDRDNRVVILTGTGDEWSGVRATPGQSAIGPGLTSNAFDRAGSRRARAEQSARHLRAARARQRIRRLEDCRRRLFCQLRLRH